MYEQKICYIDLYKNGVKCGNMGHVRMEWDEERYRFGASLCHMDRQTLVTAVLERAGGRPRTTIQNIAIIHGKGSASSDWLPLEGSEERLLFQASGETYGVCRLPKMREGVKPEEAEEKEQEESDSRAKEKPDDMPGVSLQAKEKPDDMPKVSLQGEEKPKSTPEAALRAEEKQSKMPETVSQAEERQYDIPEIIPQAERKTGGMLDAVLRTMEKQGEKQNAAQEGRQQSAVKETVVLTYPQAMEQRRQREQYVTSLSDDKWKQLCSIYPTVHPIGDNVDFIKIAPADFVILRQEYQNLVRNSFLLHGYYNYNHILLGRYPDKYYIGVPGIMHEQERLAAAMFGFVGFERAEAPKEQRENRDQFGYYMMEVGI